MVDKCVELKKLSLEYVQNCQQKKSISKTMAEYWAPLWTILQINYTHVTKQVLELSPVYLLSVALCSEKLL